MAPQLATSRLRKELIHLKKDPPPGIIAEPKESDILVWHYAVQGPTDTPYEGGVYIGKLKFHPDYPMKAPSIYMLTPSGRFAVNTKLCMSMSDFHPESWCPSWTIGAIIQGVQSFMATEELTTGGLKATEGYRKQLACESKVFNSKIFPLLFGGDTDAAFLEAEAARLEAEKVKQVDESRPTGRTTRSKQPKAKKKDNIKEQEAQPLQQTLTEQELMKRRLKNAKKKAKQKAKKAAANDVSLAVAQGVNGMTLAHKQEG